VAGAAQSLRPGHPEHLATRVGRVLGPLASHDERGSFLRSPGGAFPPRGPGRRSRASTGSPTRSSGPRATGGPRRRTSSPSSPKQSAGVGDHPGATGGRPARAHLHGRASRPWHPRT